MPSEIEMRLIGDRSVVFPPRTPPKAPEGLPQGLNPRSRHSRLSVAFQRILGDPNRFHEAHTGVPEWECDICMKW
jgi:hypothetical protein